MDNIETQPMVPSEIEVHAGMHASHPPPIKEKVNVFHALPKLGDQHGKMPASDKAIVSESMVLVLCAVVSNPKTSK